MAAAAPLDFNGFLGQIAALGTVNTDGPGFVAAMAYALTEAGRLKSWSNPATAVQLGMLTSRIRGAQIDWAQFDTTHVWFDQPIGWWLVERGRRGHDHLPRRAHADRRRPQRDRQAVLRLQAGRLRALVRRDHGRLGEHPLAATGRRDRTRRLRHLCVWD